MKDDKNTNRSKISKLTQSLSNIEESSHAPLYYSKAFISYLHEPEDEEIVKRLAMELRKQGIAVFYDRDSLNPGQPWETSLAKAIRQGMYFIACFSSHYNHRQNNYMEEELSIAIKELKEGRKELGWLIPIRLNDVIVPPLDIGNGQTLQSLQWLDLFGDWNVAIHRLLRVVRPPNSVNPQKEVALHSICNTHIESKISRFASEGLLRITDLEHRWLSLMYPIVWTPTVELMIQLYERAKETNLYQTDLFLDKSEYNRLVAVTVATAIDDGLLLRHLDSANNEKQNYLSKFKRLLNYFKHSGDTVIKQLPDHPYSRFYLRHRKLLHNLSDWINRDFVHWVFCVDKDEIQVDLLYCPSFQFEIDCGTFEMSLRKKKVSFLPHGIIYPTSLISGSVISQTLDHILQKEAQDFLESMAGTIE